MLTALKNLWNMIVKVITLGTVKGNAYIDSKITPLEKVDQLVEQARKRAEDRRHEYFKIVKSYQTASTDLTNAQKELNSLEEEIKTLLSEGNETRAKHKARLAIQKTRFIDTLNANVANFEQRKFDIKNSLDKLNTDIQILKSKRSELEMIMIMRDNSKSNAKGDLNVDGIDMSIDEFIRDVESDIAYVGNEDTAWKETGEVFNQTPTTSNTDVDDYISKFK